jgi:tRNA(fMet)-specific endonuclease VapC
LKKFLLDTNICIYLLKGLYQLDDKIEQNDISNSFISEITVAELKFGAENSKAILKNRKVVEEFISKFTIIPVFTSLDIFAKEKARLRKAGTPLEDFDLLIGATAVFNNLILVTKNVSHFERIEEIIIEDWTLE